MKELNIRTGETIFHCYKDGEWVDTKGVRPAFEVNCKVTVIDEEDLSEYDEVRMIELGDSSTSWSFVDEQEVDDDYEFEARIVKFLLPNGEIYEVTELIDDLLEWDTFDSVGDGSIEHFSITKDENKKLEDDDLIEDDEDWGW